MKIPQCGSCGVDLAVKDRSPSRKWALYQFAKDAAAIYCDACRNITTFRTTSSFFSGTSYESTQTYSEADFRREFGMGPGLIRDQPSEKLFAEIVGLYFDQAQAKGWQGSRNEVLAAVLSKLGASRAYEFLDDQLTATYRSNSQDMADQLRWFLVKLKNLSESESIDSGTQDRARNLMGPIAEDLAKRR